jgi:hypothetical protein
MKKEINVTKLWEKRKEILEGIKNKIFKSDAVEAIVQERNKTCLSCKHYDEQGLLCMVKGTGPCCGYCGCSLSIKQRSLSSSCDLGLWREVLTESEEIEHEILKEDD